MPEITGSPVKVVVFSEEQMASYKALLSEEESLYKSWREACSKREQFLSSLAGKNAAGEEVSYKLTEDKSALIIEDYKTVTR